MATQKVENRHRKSKENSRFFQPEDSVGYLLRITSRAFTRAFQQRIEQDGLTIGMWFYLRALWEQDGLTQRELSQRVETMDPSTGSALAKMERLGLIYRSQDERDGRKRYIHLTKKGRGLRDKLIRHAVELHEFATEGLEPGEVDALRVSLMKIRERLKSDVLSQRTHGTSGSEPDSNRH
jgi:DNA-binding MarR family transcriptional regulator